MATVISETSDSVTLNVGTDSFANIRGDVTSSGYWINNATTYDRGVMNGGTAGRGAPTYYMYRSYFPFDLSGESGTATSVTFNIVSDNIGTAADQEGTVFLVESTALAGSGDDYGNVFSSGTTLGTTLGLVVVSTSLGFHSCTLNSAGLAAVNSAIGSGTLTIGCMGWYDFQNSATPLDGDFVRISLHYADNAVEAKRPYLDITYGGAAAATDNATFFGTNF